MSGGPNGTEPPPGTTNFTDTCSYQFMCFVVMLCVGPRHTEKMSTNGITNATTTIHEISSNSARNAQPRNTYPQRRAKFARMSQSAYENANDRATTTMPAGNTHRHGQIGSAIRTSSSVAGMTNADAMAICVQRPCGSRRGATTYQAPTAAPTTRNAVTRRELSRAAARPTTCP